MERAPLFRAVSVIMAFVLLFSVFCNVKAYADNGNNSLSLTEEEKSYIASHDSLKVGYVTDRIPVSFQDDNGAAGITRYILDRISKIAGIEFEYVPLPSGEVTYDYLLSEGFDLVTSVEFNEENKNARGILISQPYFSSRKVVVAKDNFQFRYDGKFSVAISTGSQTLKKVLARMFPNFKLIDYESISDCFDAVNSGEADLMIQNQYVVEYWLSKPKYEKLSVIPITGLDDQLCFSAVVEFGEDSADSQKDGQILIDILDKSIAAMTEDEVGNYTIKGVMENQYEYTFMDFISRYRYAVIIFCVSALIIVMLTILLSRQRIRYAESRADAKAKGRFLSTMSHEIRTPLNGLIGLNYLMSQKMNDTEKMKEYLRQSSVTAKYLLSLVNDILDSSKLEAKKMEMLSKPIDLRLMIDTLSSIERSSIADKNIEYNVHTEIDYPYIMGDEIRIQQVILNLLDNARKFTQEGGRVDLSITQSSEGENILTTVTVKDNGKGMSEEFRKHIFDLFAQERDTVSKGNQGTGLGLSISRRLALLMGGDLTCESKKGEGSCFTFTFTAAPADPKDIMTEQSDLSQKERPRILVAEDNELNGEIIIELLRSDGFEVELANNGKKALEMFKNSEPGTFGVILMDLLMPEMDGFETSKAIRSLDRPDAKTVKIFACTANSFSEERDKAFECGMDDFIMKPVDIDVLLRKLNS